MTAFVFNVTFDCADPRTLSAFWSAVTGYEATEVRDDFVRLTRPTTGACGTCCSSRCPSRRR